MGRHMGRHKQYSLLLYNLKLSVGFERMPICISFHWLVRGTSPTLHWAECKGGDWKYKRGKPTVIDRKDEEDSFEKVWLIKDLSAWAELSCNLSVVLHLLVHRSKFLLWWDKNQGREINRPDMWKRPSVYGTLCVMHFHILWVSFHFTTHTSTLLSPPLMILYQSRSVCFINSL